ncbi:NUMOD4 domain-containing protein [Bacillus cereus]|uniref:NUMOD4 domain-containing protein n=1 Tax=Bacillus cereus VD184 TaxID=1053242 RepID=A0A9W5VPF6_BACCE|nr:NUMOD4 domain-containing protein [Bacillus cereus]EOQ01012.1 hypothetical protein IKC_06210 [Bacillus cereus VD184]
MEEWKSIEGFEGYEVSNLGQVRSIDRVTQRVRYGKPYSVRMKGRILKQTKATDYPMVTLCKGEGEYKHPKSVHSLVASAFIDNPDGLPVVNHKDLDRFNNHVDNLEWTTFGGNTQHAVDNGVQLGVKGERHYATKLTDEDVRWIREVAKENGGTLTRSELAERFNMKPSSIGNVINGTTWKHVK